MQLTRDGSTQNFIRAWESGRIRIAERWIAGNVIVSAEQIIEDWMTAMDGGNAAIAGRISRPTASPATLTVEDLAPALAFSPTILLLGTGTDRFLPDVELMAALAEQRVGLEIMSTPAACRTFNVLLQERRRVVAALFNPA
jgi:uncharacterized protein